MNPSGKKENTIRIFSFSTPAMRAFHMSWLAFFVCFFAWFAVAPLMPVIKQEFGLTPGQIANINIAAVGITILVRLIIGPLCDKYGPRRTYTGLLVLGALPVMIHPAPRQVAVIGLGSGDTAWAAGARRETLGVTVFEISSPQPRVLRRIVEQQSLPELEGFLKDPRLSLRIEDGRRAIEAGRDVLFDAIETDAIWPESAGSGNLYSLEFFEACARRLRAGGLMCTWAPTPRVRATFRTVFPHVLDVDSGAILIGSRYPIQLDVPSWEARLLRSTDYLGEMRAQQVREKFGNIQPASGPIEGDLNHDLYPRDEFAVR